MDRIVTQLTDDLLGPTAMFSQPIRRIVLAAVARRISKWLEKNVAGEEGGKK